MNQLLKNAYKNFWVPFMGRALSSLIHLLEGSKPNKNPTHDIDCDKKKKKTKN